MSNALTLTYNEAPIHLRGEMLCLTDMWKAAGEPSGRAPSDWRALSSTQSFVEFLQDSVIAGKPGNENITVVRGGKSPGTWAHWQIGFAYAKYLSPEFHAWCNVAAREKFEGIARHQVAVAEIERRVMAAIGGTLKGIVLKQIAPKIDALEQKVDNALSSYDPSAGFAVNFRPMRWFVEQAGVEQHGRRPLICAMSRRCLSWLIRNNMGENIRCSRDASRQLFQVDAVKRWMKAEGATMVQTHKDKMFGQGRLGTKRRKKGALELALHPFDPTKVQ